MDEISPQISWCRFFIKFPANTRWQLGDHPIHKLRLASTASHFPLKFRRISKPETSSDSVDLLFRLLELILHRPPMYPTIRLHNLRAKWVNGTWCVLTLNNKKQEIGRRKKQTKMTASKKTKQFCVVCYIAPYTRGCCLVDAVRTIHGEFFWPLMTKAKGDYYTSIL